MIIHLRALFSLMIYFVHIKFNNGGNLIEHGEAPINPILRGSKIPLGFRAPTLSGPHES